jgi:hypothetical protein
MSKHSQAKRRPTRQSQSNQKLTKKPPKSIQNGAARMSPTNPSLEAIGVNPVAAYLSRLSPSSQKV